jgi:hypothetical protein
VESRFHRFPFRRATATLLVALLVSVVWYAYARWIEPCSLKTLRVRLSETPELTLVHISDFHFKEDQRYLNRVVRTVNDIEPDLVCFTGDLVEDSRQLPPVLTAIEQIHAPVFAVPGNWEHWAGTDFSLVEKSCAKTGGSFLVNSSVSFRNHWTIVGIDNLSTGHAVIEQAFSNVNSTENVIFLTHCPLGVELLGERTVKLALAGHSHGGQVRLPAVGALLVPPGTGRYDLGRFDTPNGTLYVSSGIGTWAIPIRFLCRPEVTVIRL